MEQRRLLIIHGFDSSLESFLDLFAGFHVEQIHTKFLRFDQIDSYHVDLIVPIVIGAESRWLADLLPAFQAAPVPIFPILSREADSSLLALVSETAEDFALWPAHRDEVVQRVLRIVGTGSGASCRDRRANEPALSRLVGNDPAFLKLVAKIPLLARSSSTVLITGETGTGKELCARAIHHLSRRRDFPFIAVDCGAFPDHLFENEMFGHARGAFTDAHRDQRGLIAMAEGGTLFLDEVNSLSSTSQAKLLRFLQEHTYRPLGAEKFVRADVNILAASNRDLEQMVHEQQFRSDLFFRLNVLRLNMMSLRERRGDIPVLAEHFLDVLCAEQNQSLKTLAPVTAAELMKQDWPGNVRELYNVMQRAVVFARGSEIQPYDVRPQEAESAPPPEENPPRDGFRQARARAIEAFERSYLLETLRLHNGNITQSARYALQDRRAFGRLVKRYGIDRSSVHRPQIVKPAASAGRHPSTSRND